MFIYLFILVLPSIVTAVYFFSYCQSKNSKRQETQVNDVTNARSHMRLGARQPVPSIYIVPTTNQVMEMYVNQSINNERQLRQSSTEQYKPPPEYGQVVVEIPPTYEEAVVRSRNGTY